MFKRLTLAVLGAVLLAGCATPKPGSPEAIAAAEQAKQEARVAAVQSSVEDAPSWFMSPPEPDANSYYAVGTSTSSDLQLALDKATLNAKRSLADTLKSSLSSKLKEFISETGTGEDPVVTSESERVTSNLITETNVAGYTRTKTKIMPQGALYRAYVMLQYPLGNANRILVDRVKQDRILESKLRASKAFQELEQDIQAARK